MGFENYERNLHEPHPLAFKDDGDSSDGDSGDDSDNEDPKPRSRHRQDSPARSPPDLGPSRSLQRPKVQRTWVRPLDE